MNVNKQITEDIPEMLAAKGYFAYDVIPADDADGINTYSARTQKSREKLLCYVASGRGRSRLKTRYAYILLEEGTWKDARLIAMWDEKGMTFLVVGLKGNSIQRLLTRLKYTLKNFLEDNGLCDRAT